MQNGGSLYDVVELFSTDSIRKMKKVFKTLKEKQEEMQNQQLQQKQQEIDQQKQIAAAQMEQAQVLHDQDVANKNHENELDRINKKEIALIQAESKGALPDVDNNNVPDVLEINKLAHERDKSSREYNVKMKDLQVKSNKIAADLAIKREELQVARENQKNDLQIARENAKGRAKKPKS